MHQLALPYLAHQKVRVHLLDLLGREYLSGHANHVFLVLLSRHHLLSYLEDQLHLLDQCRLTLLIFHLGRCIRYHLDHRLDLLDHEAHRHLWDLGDLGDLLDRLRPSFLQVH